LTDFQFFFTGRLRNKLLVTDVTISKSLC